MSKLANIFLAIALIIMLGHMVTLAMHALVLLKMVTS